MIIFNRIGMLVAIAALALGFGAQKLLPRHSHYSDGVFLLVTGLTAGAASLYLHLSKKTYNHIFFVPVWCWAAVAVVWSFVSFFQAA